MKPKVTVEARIVAYNGDIIITLTDETDNHPEKIVKLSEELHDQGSKLIDELNTLGIDKAVWGGAVPENY
jgi:hypothetical protein